MIPTARTKPVDSLTIFFFFQFNFVDFEMIWSLSEYCRICKERNKNANLSGRVLYV